MRGERNYLVYIPLGVGVVVPPWNFPCAIMAGIVVASLVTGNTVVVKPAADSPAIAAKFIDILFEAGVPQEAVNFITGPGSVIGDVMVQHPQTRYIGFTGSKEVGLRISELAAKPSPGQIWIKRTVLEMGGKDAIVVDDEADIDAAVEGTAQAAFGFQGQKCSACSRAIVSEKVYDTFVQKLVERTKKITLGPSDDPNNYMGPVISQSAMKTILDYIEVGLTGAVYSKNPEKIKKAEEAFHVGNLYLNRKCTGAMVGAHPFGGFNMSGTDSKTGGKDY